MFDIRDLSNAGIALVIIMALASVVTVRALTSPATKTEPEFVFKRVDQLDINPNMTFNMLPNDLSVAVGDTLDVIVSVENVADMYGWQVYLCYDSAVLECVGVSLPSNYVFSTSVTVSGALAKFNNEQFPQGPLQKVRNDAGWVLAGDCLLGASQPTFYGSGVLCQIEFKAVSSGPSALGLLHDFAHAFQTYVLNPQLRAITASSASYSNVYVASQ
jgi:hypothetical protein